MSKIVIDIPKDRYDEIHSLKFVRYGLQSDENKILFYRLINAVQDGTPLEDYCFTQCETGNPCLYCKHEFENKIIDKHIDDKCTADDCDECKNSYDCISYLEEHERINNENETDN